jgi:hypothetical protein
MNKQQNPATKKAKKTSEGASVRAEDLKRASDSESLESIRHKFWEGYKKVR